MELKQSNFFATQFQSTNSTSTRYPRDSQQFHKSTIKPADIKNPVIRVRKAKSQMKRTVQSFNSTLIDFIKAEKSLKKTNQEAYRLRTNFLKLYCNKKAKVQNKYLLDSSKQEKIEQRIRRANFTRSQKLSNQLASMCTKEQLHSNNNRKQQQNKQQLELQNLRSKINLKRKQQFESARSKFMCIKQAEKQLAIRRSNLNAMMSTRARHHYLLRINEEMEVIKGFTDLLNQVDAEYASIDQEGMAKTFFVTTNNSLSN